MRSNAPKARGDVGIAPYEILPIDGVGADAPVRPAGLALQFL